MPTSHNKTGFFLLAAVSLGLVFSRIHAIDDVTYCSTPEKTKSPTVAELDERFKAGIFKLAESDVVTTAGPPVSYKRPGDAGSELQLIWEYATFIYATFKEGKLTELTGGFSDQLPVDQVTLANFNRLGLGTAEAQVVDILGEGNGKTTVDGAVTRSWGRTAQLRVSISKKGQVVNRGSSEQNFVYLPPGISIPARQ